MNNKESNKNFLKGFEKDIILDLDIIFSSCDEAEIVLDGLNEIINQYGFASVADLYELTNITNYKYTDTNYGWSERISISPEYINNEYVLRLPRVIPINK